MHRIFVMLAAAVCARAGTIQGVVLEQISGRPLSRSMVRLEPIPRSGPALLQPLTLRSGRSGQFVFPVVAPGIYLLTATHDGYFPAGFGQRLPIGRGTPIEVTADSTFFAELRMRHKGAITGRVYDENGVGTAGIPVLAYRAQLPLRSAGSAVSDDRGVYRIHGLDPGKYWIRSGAYTFDDGSGWLPTFGPAGRETREARINAVTVDADTMDADVSPEPGVLFHLGGVITCETGSAVIVILSSETGRRRTESACLAKYRFDGLAPGYYEVFATAQDGASAGFFEMFLGQDTDSANVALLQAPRVDIDIRRPGSGSPANIPVTLLGRRQDLSETDEAREIQRPRTTLSPGHWEFRAQVGAGQYVESIIGYPGAYRRPVNPERASDWFPVFIEMRAPTRITIVVSDQPGQIAGLVKADGKPSPGVPVFLWPLADQARHSLGGAARTLTDVDGRYKFDSLPPGDYRIVATFDAYDIDEDLLELSQAPVIHVNASQTASTDLTVWIAPY